MKLKPYWLKRLRDEYDQVRDRRDNLLRALKEYHVNPKESLLDGEQVPLMDIQLSAMEAYRIALKERIKLAEKKYGED